MNKSLIIFLFLLSYTFSFSQVFTDSNLPIVVINTNSQTIVDDPKITCGMGIIYNGPGNRNFMTDPFNEYDSIIGIEIRGSTSQQYPKKSYGLETRDNLGNNYNVSLLGMPKENDWILYGAYPDKTLMRNEITYSLFGQMQPYSPRYVYCELVIDGQYIGVYTLMERIKRDKNRVDIAKLDFDDNAGDSLTGGYVIKVDKLTGSSNTPWTSPYQNKVKFLYHDPEYNELTQPQKDYIKDYVTDFENAVYGPNFKDSLLGYRPFLNTGSFVDFMLMQELGRTVDGYRSSSFMYKDKDSKGGKLSCGPMWDFNLSFGNADYCDAYDTTGWQYDFANVCPSFSTEPPEWWPRLLQDTIFANEVQCRWRELRSTILATSYINNWIDSTALYLNESQQRNFQKWPILGVYVNWNYFIGNTYQEEIDYLKWWFESRSVYIDANLPGNNICPLPVSVKDNNPIKNQISIYPNPTSGIVTIKANGLDDVKLFTIDGKIIEIEVLNNSFNIKHLAPGYYVLFVNNQPFKLLKQ
jgi:hypothetical protein